MNADAAQRVENQAYRAVPLQLMEQPMLHSDCNMLHRFDTERHTLERCACSCTRRRAHMPHPARCDQMHVFGWYFGFRERHHGRVAVRMQPQAVVRLRRQRSTLPCRQRKLGLAPRYVTTPSPPAPARLWRCPHVGMLPVGWQRYPGTMVLVALPRFSYLDVYQELPARRPVLQGLA